LDGIDVHELWDRSGGRSDGYTSPEDMAFEMFEEALVLFHQELFRLFDLNMRQESIRCCMGILKCENCKKIATQICSLCMEDYCDKCIEAHECGEDYVMPIVNSPRTGVCAYVGPLEE